MTDPPYGAFHQRRERNLRADSANPFPTLRPPALVLHLRRSDRMAA